MKESAWASKKKINMVHTPGGFTPILTLAFERMKKEKNIVATGTHPST